MHMSSKRPLLLLYCATGATGKTVVESLLHSDDFRIGVISRSASTPLLEQWKEQGIEIRTLDVGSASEAQLETLLEGVDYLVSFCTPAAFDTQRKLFEAAKKAGVRRVVPSDFGPWCPPGVTMLQDIKLGIHEHVRSFGVPYTFVNIGWWSSRTLPYPHGADDLGGPVTGLSRRVYGAGDKKCAITDTARVADFLVRILPDPRTENQTVFCWEDEVTQNEAWELAVREADEGAEVLKLKETISEEQLEAEIAAAKAAYERAPSWQTFTPVLMYQHQYMLFIRGDNTRANAVAAGALDARELYPEFVPVRFEEYAKAWFRAPKPFPYQL